MNAFEAGSRKSIPAVLVYARHQGKILMLHRNAGRPGDYHDGKWNGLGGKLEPDESPLEAARREFFEEAGVELPLERFKALGSLTFPNFKAHKSEDWVVWVFTAEIAAIDASHILTHGAEGALHWIPEQDLLRLNLWPGDQHFIPQVVAEKPFIGTIWYDGPEVVRHWVVGL